MLGTGVIIKSIFRQSQKDKDCVILLFYLYEESKEVKFIEAESRMEVARDRGRRNGELLFNEYRVSDLPDEKVGEIGCRAM